jgi:hypothetical protein
MSFDEYRVSRAQLVEELEEKTADLKAFSDAREIIRKRVLEVKDSQCQLTPLPHWSGTDAVLGSLDLSIHAMERTIAELRFLLEHGPEESPRRTALRLVKERHE